MKGKILVVDNELGIIEVIKKRFEANQYEVITANDGIDAFVKASNEKPDLIILNVFSPAMDGLIFMQAARSFEMKHVPILILTVLRSIQEPFKNLGIDYYFTEPFDSKELLGKVDEAILDFTHT